MDPVETTRGYQARLRNLGFGSDPIDGIHGPKTRAAVRAFQRFADLDIDGIVGPNTQRKLADAYGC
ncbi:MAG: peptidoglycan-binding protein [Nannocystaceae bacterium]|nr:peptidoglycan-binding protein [Nannocystaceae bacterium]